MEKKNLKTGIFGGSYNPIHIGHLALANYLCEFGDLDEIWFMVSPQNPFKKNQQMLDDHFRLEMVEAAITDYPRFKACDVEFQLPRPSYTAHTLEHLAKHYPEREFTLIIGADNWNSFDRWREPEKILAHHHILIYPRPGYPVDENNLPENVRLMPTPQMDISSTFIRDSIRQGKDIRYFLHPAVFQIIKERNWYKDTI